MNDGGLASKIDDSCYDKTYDAYRIRRRKFHRISSTINLYSPGKAVDIGVHDYLAVSLGFIHLSVDLDEP